MLVCGHACSAYYIFLSSIIMLQFILLLAYPTPTVLQSSHDVCKLVVSRSGTSTVNYVECCTIHWLWTKQMHFLVLTDASAAPGIDRPGLLVCGAVS